MNDKDLTTDIVRQALNRSLQQIDAPVLSRLQNARATALHRHAQLQHKPLLAWANSHWSNPMERPAAWAAALLLAVTLLGGGIYWQQVYDNSDDIDIAILTDDLPIDNYVD